MKNKKLILLTCSVLAISLVATGCGKDIEVKNGAKVAVSTNSSKITANEYYNEIKEENITKLINMIDEGLFEEKYKKTTEEDESVQNQIDQIKQYYGSDESQYNAILQTYFGVNDEKELEESLRLEYKRSEAVKDAVEKSIKDDEVQKYYDENVFGEIKASRILIKIETKDNATDLEKEKAKATAKKEAEKVISELNKGKSFESLAKKYSDDENTKNNGGNLGYFKLEEANEDYFNTLKDLKKNEYNKTPLETDEGYEILMKTGEKDKKKLTKSYKAEIREILRDEKLNSDSSLYYQTLKDIREEAKIKWNDTNLKKAYNEYMDKLIEQAKQSDQTTTSTTTDSTEETTE